MSPLAFVANVPAMHGALMRTPGAIARGVEAVRRACPGIRVVLLGASLVCRRRWSPRCRLAA